jgi:hypothetical protein
MRIKKLILTAILASLASGATAYGLLQWYRSEHPAPPEGERLPEAVIVFCFHGDASDETYSQVERCAKGVVEKYFADELANGKLVWRVVNYEDAENKNVVSELQVVAPCIMLADVRPDRPNVATSLQPKAWKLADRPEALKTFLREEIEKALK